MYNVAPKCCSFRVQLIQRISRKSPIQHGSHQFLHSLPNNRLHLVQNQVGVLVERLVDAPGNFCVPVDQIVEVRSKRLDVDFERLHLELVMHLVVLRERLGDELRVDEHICCNETDVKSSSVKVYDIY